MKCQICNQEMNESDNRIAILKSPLNIFGKAINYKFLIWFLSSNLKQKIEEEVQYTHGTCYVKNNTMLDTAFQLPLAGGLSISKLTEVLQQTGKKLRGHAPQPFLTKAQYTIMPILKPFITLYLIYALLNSKLALLNFFPIITYILLGLAFILVLLESIATYKAGSYANEMLNS